MDHQFKRDGPQETLSRTGCKRGGRIGDLPPQEREPLARSRASAENPGRGVPQGPSRAPLKSTFEMQGHLRSRAFPTGKQDRQGPEAGGTEPRLCLAPGRPRAHRKPEVFPGQGGREI